MSPINNQPTLRELDGLPAGEIKLLVAESEQRVMDAVDARLTVQDGKLESMQSDISILVGNARLEGLVQGTKKAVESLTARHDGWHEEDVAYRSEMKSKMLTLEADTKKTVEQLAHINWFVVGSHGVGRLGSKGLELLKAEAFWKVAGVGVVLYAMEKLTPVVYHWIVPILQMVK